MAFAVSIGAGYGKMTVRLSTAEQALAEAQTIIEHGKNVSILIASTGEEFSVDEFAAKMSAERVNA